MPSASKSSTLYSNNGYAYTINASFNENSTNVANNTSNITCSATLTPSSAYWSTSYPSTLIIYWHDNRENYDREVASITFNGLSSASDVKSVSGTINVTHKDDGSLSGYAYAYFDKGSTTTVWACNSGGVSTNNTALTTIARASQPTISPSTTFNIGDTITINTNRKSTAFTHTVTFYFGNYSYQIATGVTDSVDFDTSTIANNMYQQIPNASVGEGNVTVVTYNGNTQIGTKNVIFNAKVINSSPIFSCAYLDTNSTTTAITNNNQQIIRNNSTLQVNVTNAQAKNYASLSSASVNINGVVYNGSFSGSSVTFNIGVLNLSSNTTAVVTVTDSRGISTSQNLSLIILNWMTPTAIINLQRENNYYSETNINVNADYFSLDNKNAITIKARYKKVSDGSYSSYVTLQDEVTTQLTLDNEYAWNIQVLVQDRIGSTTYNLILDRGIPIAFFDRLKRSVGINSFPKNNETLDILGGDLLNVLGTKNDTFISGNVYLPGDIVSYKRNLYKSDTGIANDPPDTDTTNWTPTSILDNLSNVIVRIAGYGQGANQVTGDWDDACGTASGFYMGNGLSHSPSGTTVDNWWWVIHIVHNNLYQRQIAFSFLNNSQVFTRIMNNGTWNSWSLLGSNVNSTSEIATGEWINNKPIYRKTIQTGAISSNTVSVAHNISNLDKVISIKGMAEQSGSFYTLPRTATGNVTSQIELYVTNTNVVVHAGSNANFTDSFVIVEYTKT